jgi:hypothetical protein
MHQVEGDLGGGVNISANLVRLKVVDFADCLVGDFETRIPVFGQKGFSRKSNERCRREHI